MVAILLYVPNNKASKYTKQNLTGLKGETESIIVEEFKNIFKFLLILR